MVGETAMRDPLTGELLDKVPLYVDAGENGQALPEIDLKTMARDFMRKMRVEEKKEAAGGATLTA
jgi:hypothetical protein